MRVYFGAGIQGAPSKEIRAERVQIYKEIIEAIRESGHDVMYEHTATNNREEAWAVLERQFGKLPTDASERAVFIRNKNIEAIEELAEGAVFEVSMPSHGVGIEIAHAYLREKLGRPSIPVLLLYQKNFWGHGLSVMVSGLQKVSDQVTVLEYDDSSRLRPILSDYFATIKNKNNA